MPDTYQEYKKIPDTTHFSPYFPTCPNKVTDLQNELADSLNDADWDDVSQIDHSEIAVHNVIAHENSNSTVDCPALIISSSTDSYDDQELDSHSKNVPERPNRVRFRSRVRITSGLHRHRHTSQQQQQHQSGIDYLKFSPATSISGSPSSSSSISVPLHTHTDEQVGKPGWGTLGQRVSLFARGNMERRKIREQRERLGLGVPSFRKGLERRGFRGGEDPAIPYVGTDEVSEGTPLLFSPASRHRYPASNANDHRHSDSPREDEANQMSGGIDSVFGSWWGRLANYHWWLWQVEPIICFRCLSDSDDEG